MSWKPQRFSAEEAAIKILSKMSLSEEELQFKFQS